MGEHCEACGAEINDSTIMCKCGCNIQVQRLTRQVELLESANDGWRRTSKERDAKVAALEETLKDRNEELGAMLRATPNEMLQAALDAGAEKEMERVKLQGRIAALEAENERLQGRLEEMYNICPDCEKHITMERLDAGDVVGCCRATLDRIVAAGRFPKAAQGDARRDG